VESAQVCDLRVYPVSIQDSVDFHQYHPNSGWIVGEVLRGRPGVVTDPVPLRG